MMAAAILGACAGGNAGEEKSSTGFGSLLANLYEPEPTVRLQLVDGADARGFGFSYELLPPERFVETALVWSLADDGVATVHEIQQHVDELDAEQRRRLMLVLDQSYLSFAGRQLADVRTTLQHGPSAHAQSIACSSVRYCLNSAATFSPFDDSISIRMNEERVGGLFQPRVQQPIRIVDAVAQAGPAVPLTFPFPSARDDVADIPELRWPPAPHYLTDIDVAISDRLGRAGFPNYAAYTGEQGRLVYVSQAERVHYDDGTPFDGTRRWSEEPLGCPWRTAFQWGRCIIGGSYTEVHLRVFVFVFADQPLLQRETEGDARDLMDMGRYGPRSLPRPDPVRPENRMHVLVYEIFAEGGVQGERGQTPALQFRLQPTGSRTATEHLRLARFMETGP